MRLIKSLALSLALSLNAICLLCQCTANQADKNPERLEAGAYYDLGEADAEGLASIQIPILRSPELERRWGEPSLKAGPDGGYAISYSNPDDNFESLTIIGSPTSFPAAAEPEAYRARHELVQPKWQSPVEILGKPVRYAQASDLSGADPIEYRSETFALGAPGGKTASYRLFVTTNLETADAASYMGTVNW